jgi:hypothetical protein
MTAETNRIQPGQCSSAAAGCRKTTAPAVSTKRLLRTVHQRPPKKIAPSKPPGPRQHQIKFHSSPSSCSSRMALSSLATQCQAFKQPRTRPATSSASVQEWRARMAFVQPETKRRAEQRRNHHRPADQPHHAQAKPDPRRGVFPRLELARRLRADLPAKAASSRGLILSIFHS